MKIIIRHQEDRDLDAIAELFTFESLTENTSQIYYNHPSHWHGLFKSSQGESVQLVAEIEGRLAGHLGIHLSTKPRAKHVASFGISVHPDYQGQGVGSALMAEMIKLCDNWLNIVRIELGVFTDNEVAVSLYKKFGFEIEGIARFNCFKRGKYADTYAMARIRPDHF